ncbi:guanylyl cyclase C [Brachyhypopomus gauderio]|uniref:guanylyl cyclase C n=1 Tax=Brachyhypopomus gauderio TaxID=698409 RepID=UPI0040437526
MRLCLHRTTLGLFAFVFVIADNIFALRDMWSAFWVGCCCALVAVAGGFDAEKCKNSSMTLNIVLLEDEDALWSLRFVRAAVEEAIEDENRINQKEGLNFTMKVNFRGFNTTYYRRRGCGSSTCEGVEILKSLHNTSEVGCAMLGPSCTYATFQLVDQDVGLILTIPIISAGSFGLSCDFKDKLTRLLPPARKVSNFFVHFWNTAVPDIKPKWDTAYVYKTADVSEECFWYLNALDAATAQFATETYRKVLRSRIEIIPLLSNNTRLSNIFILCGSPNDVLCLKNETIVDNNVVFILIDLFNHGYHINESSFDYMRNVLVLTVHSVRTYNITNNSTMNDYVAGYHDGVKLFGHVMREKLLANQGSEGKHNLTADDNPFRNISFDGMGGNYKLDENGDRDVNFSLIYTSETYQYKTLFVFDTSTNYTETNHTNPDLPWEGSRLPDDKPANAPGRNDHNEFLIIMIVLAISVVLVTAVALLFYRQYRRQRYYQKKWSHIHPDLITPLDNKETSLISLKIDEDKRRDSTYQIHKGRYDKKPVILKELRHNDGTFSERQRIELNSLLRIDYYNLTKFYGTVKYEYGVFAVFEFCERGSLRYVLNDKISYPNESFMDLEFKISVMYDIAKGMSYLHSSNIEIHGRLKSTNCVVDNRMVVKITDFGCNTILIPGKDLWTAPEHMRVQGISQKGDAYSFAIIAHEILLRECPFYTESCTDVAEKLYRVQCPSGPVVFRPDLNFETAGEKEIELYVLIKNCWDEDPEKRPDFKKIESVLGKIFSNLHDQANASYMDNLIRRLQMYSRNLEHLVEERTALYKAERDRADQLNFMLLPGPVVRSLKETGRVEPELFDEVTIYFSDIVGFTTICHHSTPMEVVDMLNDMYKSFDSILDNHDVYKVETIGDAYMVVSGLPRRNGTRHAVDICLMALDILEFMGTFQLRHLPGIPLWIRIGVHSGPCAAGVVGNKMPRYCLFGDTVNTASRMESTGLPLRIHVSQSTISILKRTECQFEYERRGETYLKGKGKEMTYWLKGVTARKYNLPTPPTAENFQRLQQDLAELVVSTLHKRGHEKRTTLSTPQRRSQRQGSDGLPEYLHLADPSTYL